MAVPKHRRTSSKRGQRRMHLYIKPALLTTCQKCGRPARPHIICRYCGYYKGQEFIDVLSKLTKKEKKLRKKEMERTEKTQKMEGPMSMEELSKK